VHFIRTECLLTDATRPPPEWLNSPVPLVRAEIQRRRRAAGMSNLPPYVPKVKKVTFAAPIMTADPYIDEAQASSSYNTRIFMIRRDPSYAAVQHSQKHRPEEVITFDTEARSFTCKACQHPCDAPMAHKRPQHVFCGSCGLIYYTTEQLPDTWMHTSIWDRPPVNVELNQLAVVPYSGGAFGSSIAETSSYAASERQLEPFRPAPPPIRTRLPGAPLKDQAGYIRIKLAKLYPLILKGKNSAMSEFELLLQHAPPEERERYIAQCQLHDVPLACLQEAQQTATQKLPLPEPVQLDARPRLTTPARPLPNRFASPSLQALVRSAKEQMEAAAMKAPESTPLEVVIEQHVEPAATSQLALPSIAAQTAGRATQQLADAWECALASDLADAGLASDRGQATQAGPAVSPGSRAEDPYPDGNSYMNAEQPSAQYAAGGAQPAYVNTCPSPRTYQPDAEVQPTWPSTQLNPFLPSNMMPIAPPNSAWYQFPAFSQPQPSAPETRSVYRTDDGYVHLSVSVLKASMLWDESWDASNGELFLQHLTRLDSRHKALQEQVRVLEVHRDELMQDRALRKYTNVSTVLEEMQLQITQLHEARAADSAAAAKAAAVRDADVTLLRNTVAHLTTTQKTLQTDISHATSSTKALGHDSGVLQTQTKSLAGAYKATVADLDLLRQEFGALKNSTMDFATEATSAISVIDADLGKMTGAVNAYAVSLGASVTMEQAADLLDQVTRIQGQILAVNNPRRDVWLASIASRVKRTDDMQQSSALQLGELRKALDSLESELRHVPGEVTALYKQQQANEDSILTTWVHIQTMLTTWMPDWRERYGIPSDDTQEVKYVAKVPDVDPEEYRLELAPSGMHHSHADFFQAPYRQPDPSVYSFSTRTPAETPTHADVGGSEAPDALPLISVEEISRLSADALEQYIRAHDLRFPDGAPIDLDPPADAVDWRLRTPPAPAPVPTPIQRSSVKVPKLDLSSIISARGPTPTQEPCLPSPTEILHTSTFLFPSLPEPTSEPEQAAGLEPAAAVPKPEHQPVPEPAPQQPQEHLQTPIPASPMDIDPRSVQKASQEASTSLQSTEAAPVDPPAAEPKAAPRPTRAAAKKAAKSQAEPVSMQADPEEYSQAPRRGGRVRISKYDNLSERSLAQHASDAGSAPSSKPASVVSNEAAPEKRVAMFRPTYTSDDVQAQLDCYDYQLEQDDLRSERLLIAQAMRLTLKLPQLAARCQPGLCLSLLVTQPWKQSPKHGTCS
jgi:hypothetical protein